MVRTRIAATLRSALFNSSSVICLSKARHLLLPIVAGAAFAIGGTAFVPDALAAVGVCAPDASGTPAATGLVESCSGDFATGISYPGALGTGGNFEVDLNSVTNVTDGGVIVSAAAAVNVTITQFAVPGNISNLAGNGIEATTLGGNITITTVGGNVTASGIGIYGEQLLAAGNGSVTISAAGNITGSAGIVGQVQGDVGNVLITTAAGTVVSANGYTALVDSNVAIYASAPDGDANEIAGNVTVSLGNFTAVTLTNAFNGAGISADTFGDAGNVNVTLGNGATITLNDGTGNDASGIYAVAQDKLGGNLITGNVAVTLNNSATNHSAITVSGDNNTAITARSEGNGSVTVSTGANNDLSVTGETSFGIWATGGVTGTGNISVTTGAGSDIAVNAGDGVGGNYTFSAGIRAQSNGGNVAVTTAGNITVSGFSAGINPTVGILASTTGGGGVSVIAGGAVTSQWGAGITAASLDGNITVTSTGPISAGGLGIQAVSSGNGTVAVEAPTTAIINAGTTGIYAASTGGNVSVGSSAYIGSTFTGATDAGIRAVGNTGTVLVQNAGNMSALSGVSFGIVATSMTGGIAVTNLAQIGAAGVGNGINSIGIAAQSIAGNNVGGISIVNSNKIYVDSTVSTVGIFASNAGSGSVSVTNYGDIDQPVTGINGSGAGDVNVTNHAAAVSATVFGINSFSSGGGSAVVFQNMTTTTAGNVTSFNNPNVTVSAGAFGIIAQSIGGNVLVSGTGRDLTGNGTTGDDGLAGNVTLTDGLGNGTANGILASASANGNATIRLASASAGNATFGASTRGAVTVSSADFVTGIGAATQAGDINVLLLDNTVAGGSITVTSSSGGAGNAGISAIAVNGNSTTSGSVVINTGNFNNISVSGDNSVGVLGQSSYGNVSITTGANASLTVAANSSGGNEAGYTGSYGIVAGVTNGGTGNVTVNSNAVITVTNNAASSTIGIRASNSGGGTLNVIANAAITSNGGSAIAAAGGTGPVGISNSASIRGLGTSAGTAVVNVSSVIGNATTGNITINNNAAGVIASVGGSASDLAIGATTSGTGIVTINNAGRITGAVDLSGAGASVFNNTSATSWHTSGASTFTGGSDTLTNSSTGRLATSGAATFNFLGNAGPSDVIINSGTLVVGETSGASSLTITKTSGNLTMGNSGTIVLGGQSTGLNTDGQTNDQLLAKGANMAFVASGNSRLKIDAFLGAGAEAQSSVGTGCALTAAFADCMTIGASSVATGSTGTRVSINDTNSAGSGAINLPGTVIVDGTSGAAGDFFLSTSDTNVVNTAQGLAIRKGFVLYQLVFDEPNADWDLVGVPAAETFELSKVTAGLQTVWHETADGWNERTSAIRHDFAADTMVRAWTIWGKAYYGQANRDSDNTIAAAGTPFTFDTTYTQSYGGIQFGADVSRRTANGAWALGGLIGYNKTRVEYDASSDSIDGTVINIGAYGSFMAGPFFADLLVKDDFATLDFDLPAYAGIDNVDANSIGAELTFGGRFGRRIVFEPLGTLAYVKTAVGNLDSAAMNFNWEDGTSFRGIFALRLSGELGSGQTRLQPFVLGGIGREFDGENNLLLTTGSSSLSIMDKPVETFEIASLGLNVLGTGGWSGFIRADGLLSPDYHSASIRVGMRIR